MAMSFFEALRKRRRLNAIRKGLLVISTLSFVLAGCAKKSSERASKEFELSELKVDENQMDDTEIDVFLELNEIVYKTGVARKEISETIEKISKSGCSKEDSLKLDKFLENIDSLIDRADALIKRAKKLKTENAQKVIKTLGDIKGALETEKIGILSVRVTYKAPAVNIELVNSKEALKQAAEEGRNTIREIEKTKKELIKKATEIIKNNENDPETKKTLEIVLEENLEVLNSQIRILTMAVKAAEAELNK